MNDNQAICLKCGVEKGKGNAYCPNCGKGVNEKAVVCLSCGVSLQKEEEKKSGDNLNGHNRFVLAIVAFFFGGLGIHNFMMGEAKKGVARIIASCCCGIGIILALIDLIKLLMGSYVIEPDKII